MLQLCKFVITLAVAGFVRSSPVPSGRWVDPCGGSTPVSGPALFSTVSVPLADRLNMLKHSVPQAKDILGSIDGDLRSLITTSLSTKLDSQPQLPGMPSTQSSYTSGIQIVDFLTKEVNRLSAISVFLEHIISENPEYVNDVRDLQNVIASLLCTIHNTLEENGGSYPSDVTRAIMPENIRNLMDIARRHMRNYLVVRDVKPVFDTFATGIDQYIQENNLN